jgi:hypothetical protein
MSALQGLVSFPGLATFKSATYTASHGIAPGVCTIEMPQELVGDMAAQGDLTFSYGDSYVTLFSCVVDTANVDRSAGGFIARVQLFDRRWAWQFGFINGHYNLPGPGTSTSGGTDSGDGTAPPLIRADTEMDPQGLATLCLQAMGESVYDVSALPDSSRPETHWSFENPAQALEQLCESLGCRVVLDLDSNGVRIVVLGEGDDLPEGPVQWVSDGVKPAEPPSSLLFVAGQTVQQGCIPLAAVGRDTSGAIVPINQLSYTPKPDGWPPETLIFPSITTEPAHTYAEESLYRWWQPLLPFTAPDGTVVSDLKQLILFDRQLDTNLDPDDPNGATTQRPEILGYFDPCYAQCSTSPTTVLTYHGSIQVDQNRGLVVTGDPLVSCQYGQNLPATLWLKTSFSLRDPVTREPSHYTQSYSLDGSSNLTQPQIVRHDELVLQVRGIYSSSGGISLTGETDNSGVISQAATYYLQAVAAQYQPVDSLDVPYVGIVPIQVDGAIHQVTYSIQSGDGGSCLTRASRNTEHSHYIPKYERRRDKVANKAVGDRVISQKSLFAQQQQTSGQPFVR